MSDNGARPDVELAAIAAAHPPRTVTIDTAMLTSDLIGNGAMMQIAQLCNLPLRQVRWAPDDPRALDIAYALAYVILRRAEPDLTLDEVKGYNLVIRGSPAPAAVDPTSPASSGSTPT